VSGHFGRQVRKERVARGWSLTELARRTQLDDAHLGRIERGLRPPTELIAGRLDEAFPERAGWFSEFYRELQEWGPAGFKSWQEHEEKAAELLVWVPGIVDGLAQTPDYAREILSVSPGATAEVVETRLTGRLERQRRILRDDGPTVILLVDMAALYRAVGSAEVMAGECARLAEVARLGTVTLQVVPPVTIPLATASLMLADNAAYTENAHAGSVYTDHETVGRLRRLITTVRAEARPASESLAIIRKAEQQWIPTRSASRPTAATAGRHALR
jgi:transcriptional regulator with XRE-family HTH domain